MMFIKTAACYIRVSTDKQEELSPASQKKLLLEYAKKHDMSLSEENIFMEDGGVSGKTAKRRSVFQQMIAIAKSPMKPFDVILVWKYSRFARNQEESIVYKNMLARDGVSVISISEPLADGPYGTLIERIIEWMDEYYSVNLSQEVLRGMKENALRGNYQSGPPLGYDIPHSHSALQINFLESQIIQLIFEKFCIEKKGTLEIAKELNQLGLKTKCGKDFESRGVQYILQNPVYIGKIRWNRVQKQTNQEKPSSEWVIEQGKHPSIISEELFSLAQTRIQKERNSKKYPDIYYKHYLSGLIKCSSCGRALAVSSHYKTKEKQKMYYLQCYGYLKGKCSVSHYISGKNLIPVLLYHLHILLDHFDMEYEYISKNFTSCSQKESSLIQAQLEKLIQKEMRIKTAYINGIDSIDEYQENKKAIQAEKALLSERQKKFLSEDSKPEVSISDVKVKNVTYILENDRIEVAVKNHALRSIIDKIVFDKNEFKIKIFFAEMI